MTPAASPPRTPMMRQYFSFKEQHKDAILFFRMGDFYEMFFADAELASRELGLTLTTRDKAKSSPIPMAGVPHHAADGYIARLVAKGYRVAVCEQLGDPVRSKGLVERGIVEIVTPGTALNDSLIPDRTNNFVAALVRDGDTIGFAASDIGTGEFFLEDVPLESFSATISQLNISEWLTPGNSGNGSNLPIEIGQTVRRPEWWFEKTRGEKELKTHFGVASLRGFDCEDLGPALGAGGALLAYLQEVRGSRLEHLVRARRLGTRNYMVLDEPTRRNLELTTPLAAGDHAATLLVTLDRTITSPGARRLRTWMERPLVDPGGIRNRLDAVDELVHRPTETVHLRETLKGFKDLERLLGKTAAEKASPRDLRALGEGSALTPELKEVLGVFQTELLKQAAAVCPDLAPLGNRILEAVSETAPLAVGDGTTFREGWNADLDELRLLARGGKEWIVRLQERERKKTGIPSLKVGYNRVFGYYIEVTAAHQARVPDHYIRKQTLVNAERYITPELKEEEEKILRSEEQLRSLERELFSKLCRLVLTHAEAIQTVAETVAQTDVLSSLAEVAREKNFSRPEISEDPVLILRESRHPVVESLLPSGEFVPNDLDLDTRNRQIGIITGPNMAGKSTFLRQAGLIVIMAQMGSFVPAAKARLGIVDRVFTRVGASDNISQGRSTFMVEMEETATILNAATGNSLVLLDEVGRGTSTYDGLSIAWAVTEHLHTRAEGKPRTLFATHFHELTGLSQILSRAVNLTVEVKEWNGKVVFLRNIREGVADRSYGIHVAELAGLPPEVVDRAKQVLARLEESGFMAPGTQDQPSVPQLTLFEPVSHELVTELAGVDPDRLTPLEALALIVRWKEQYRGRRS